MSPRTTTSSPTVHCLVCSSVITDEYLKYQYYQEEYPDILIGPYCPTCFQNIRVCSGCQKPFTKGHGIKYYKKGLWYCDDCAADLTACTVCNSIVHTVVDIDGEKVCPSCVSSKYFHCNYCNKYHKADQNVYRGDDRPIGVGESSDSELNKAKWPTVYSKYNGQLCAEGFQAVTATIKPKEIVRCKNCQTLKATDSMQTEEYCKECYSTFKKCAICSKKHPTVRTTKIDGKNISICKSCLSRVPTCDYCGKHTNKVHTIKGGVSTYKICSVCHDSHPNLNECPICLSLQADMVGESCIMCSQTYINNKCHCGSVQDFNGDCRSCGDRQDAIYNYSTKPRLFFNYLKGERGELFFGIENEMTFSNEDTMRKSLKSLYKMFDTTVLLAKSDGSISGPGYEVVTQPMTLSFFNKLNVAGWFGTAIRSSSCGMHVHMQRKSFISEVHLYKFINFIHDNEKFCDKIAGRSYTNYNTKLENKPSRAVKKGSSSRYCRVNTYGEHTIEIRMFAGCISEFELRYRVEFLHALWSFCKSVSISQSVSLGTFKKYVQNNEKVYYNLSKFLLGV